MSSQYGAIGTNPLRDLDATVEHLIAEFLKANYDPVLVGVPLNKVLWEQWGIPTGEYSLYFQDVGDFDMSTEISWSIQDIDHFTEIHIFAKSLHDDYARSGARSLFYFQRWIKKVLREQKTALADQGIMVMEYRDARIIPPESDKDDIRRIVITVRTKIMLINNATLI
jgi:hypothetical protein